MAQVVGLARAASSERSIETRGLVRLGACMFGIACGFYLTLSTAPAHLSVLGGDIAAGAATTISTFLTALSSVFAPRLVARFGRRAVFVSAAVGLGLPCFMLFGSSLTLAALACAIRGVALGLAFVAAGGLAAQMAPPSRRGEFLGLYGLAFSVPAIFAVPLGLWLLSHFGTWPLALIGSACATAPLLFVDAFPPKTSAALSDAPTWRLPWRALSWPIIAQTGAAAAVGVMITAFASIPASGGSGAIAVAMGLHGFAVAVTRWWGGRLADRHGASRLVITGSCLGFMALLLLGLDRSATALVVFAAALGTAFGFQQNGTLTLMLERLESRHTDGINAVWNIAYDAGLGLGALAFGGLTPVLGFRATITAIAIIIAATNAFGFALRKFQHSEWEMPS